MVVEDLPRNKGCLDEGSYTAGTKGAAREEETETR